MMIPWKYRIFSYCHTLISLQMKIDEFNGDTGTCDGTAHTLAHLQTHTHSVHKQSKRIKTILSVHVTVHMIRLYVIQF